MLSVSPPGPSSFEDRFLAYKGEDEGPCQDAILGGGWDLAPLSSASAPSSSSSSPVHYEASPSSPHARRFSETPDMTSSGLLIRSKCQGWERSFELHHDWPIPRLQNEDEVLIKNESVGLNPVDFKSLLYNFGIADTPWILGRDIAGVVDQVGPAVKDLVAGQRVWLCADSRDVRSGAYQAYSVARSVHVGRISDSLSSQEAATLGTGLVTAAIAAYWFFEWPRASSLGGKAMPREMRMDEDGSSERRGWVLIYGGGSITGIFLAQLAHLSGLKTIAIASKSNFDYLTSLGVTHCVDRYLEADDMQEKVLALVGDEGVTYCLDTVGSKTATTCHGILRSAGRTPGEMVCLAGDPKTKSVNTATDRPSKMRRTMAGNRAAVDAQAQLNRPVKVHKISFSTTFYGDDVFARSVMADLDTLLDQRQLLPARPQVYPDGLAGVRRGLEALRDNQAPGARKLVINLHDTPHDHVTNLGVRAELGWNGCA